MSEKVIMTQEDIKRTLARIAHEIIERSKSLENLVDYCRSSMGGLRDEQFRVIFLNSQNEIIAEEIVQEGTVNQTILSPTVMTYLPMKTCPK